MMNPLQSPHAKYHDIADHGQDHAHALEDGSSTDYEDDDKLAWDDDVLRDASHLGRRKSRAKRIRGVISSCRALLDTVLLVVILWLLVDRKKTGERGERGQVGGDVTGFAPEFSQQITKFSPDPSFIPTNVSAFFSDAVQKRWLDIVPRGLGYVTINDTAPYDNLPTPLVFYPDNTFTTSMTHQLHCLHSIIGIVAALSSGRTDRLPPEGPWHVAHCFDYLRQSIMCSGDVALEGQQTTFPAGFKGSDGWDAKHVCKDYGEIMAYLEGRRADDERWI